MEENESGAGEFKVSAEDENGLCLDPVAEAAKKAFGISYLYPWQRIVIANVLDCARGEWDGEETDMAYNGRQIVLLPTGAGKSLCFLVPALMLDGPTLVLYPLLALMADQKRRMDEGGISCVVFRGGQSQEEREENFRRLQDPENPAKIILANPEVLSAGGLSDRLSRCGIKHVAIDEAHCVSEWGDTFRPAYLTLGELIRKLNAPSVTAFTATASPKVLARISEVLFDGRAHIVRSDSDRPNIHYTVVNAYAKKRAACELAVKCRKPMVIFCGTRKKSEDMARELSMIIGEDKVRFYHAGLECEEKTEVENWFFHKTDGVIACTCALGMGWDKKDIRTVIHLEPSPTAEAYIQEAGRGGRDGKDADAYLLWSPADSMRARKFSPGSRERVLCDFAESVSCRRQVLLDALGGEQAVCSGCDVCRTGEKAPAAWDAKVFMNIALRNQRLVNRDQLCLMALRELGRIKLPVFGRNVYDHSDCEEIFMQLEDEGKLCSRKGFFGDYVDLGSKERCDCLVPFKIKRRRPCPVQKKEQVSAL